MRKIREVNERYNYIDFGYRHLYRDGELKIFQITNCTELKVEIYKNPLSFEEVELMYEGIKEYEKNFRN